MGLSHKQLRTVVEVFNPECFGQRTDRHGLTAGRAFDIVFGRWYFAERYSKRNHQVYHLGQTRSCFDFTTMQVVFPVAEFVEKQTWNETWVDAPVHWRTSQGKKVVEVCHWVVRIMQITESQVCFWTSICCHLMARCCHDSFVEARRCAFCPRWPMQLWFERSGRRTTSESDWISDQLSEDGTSLKQAMWQKPPTWSDHRGYEIEI